MPLYQALTASISMGVGRLIFGRAIGLCKPAAAILFTHYSHYTLMGKQFNLLFTMVGNQMLLHLGSVGPWSSVAYWIVPLINDLLPP